MSKNLSASLIMLGLVFLFAALMPLLSTTHDGQLPANHLPPIEQP